MAQYAHRGTGCKSQQERGAFAFEICNRIVPEASNQDSLQRT